MRTATVLVIACPHALGLAIPLVIAISTSLGAQNGLLIKDRMALERRWYESCSCYLSDAYPDIKAALDAERAASAAPPGRSRHL